MEELDWISILFQTETAVLSATADLNKLYICHQEKSTMPLFWFRLVGPDGQPYRESDASSISLSSSAVVDQFRDAVIRRSSNLLSSFDACQLKVFKNKFAFDKTSDTEKQFLEADSLISGLGTSTGDALIVMVPLLLEQYRSLLHPCQIPFFNDLCNASYNDGWLLLGHNIPPSRKLDRIYVRESFRIIASSIIQPDVITKAIVSGTPGVGKSMFILYLLWHLVKARKRVLLIFRPYKIYFDGQGGVFSLSAIPPMSDLMTFWTPDLWCLYDSDGFKSECLSPYPFCQCSFVLATAPNRELIKVFKKPWPPASIFYLPTWAQTEMEKIAPFFPHVSDWQERFRFLGGMPLYVLEYTDTDASEMLRNACRQCELDGLIKPLNVNSPVQDRDVHILVHMTSAPPSFDKSSVCYASEDALKVIFEEKRLECVRRFPEFLASSGPLENC